MTTRLVVLKDINGNVFYGIPFSNKAYNTTLAAGTAQSIPVPTDAEVAIITWSSGADIFVNPTGTAVLPGGSPATTTTYMNPISRPVSVISGANISVITSATAAYVEISFYTLSATGNP